ncbi:MAG: OadG family protein [Treponema sp.]|nr:OadG family protein [Spirochaetales bacterium]MDY4525337.1 OadG family protein [Treponema sp.]MDY4831983.1 OadG family protein [Treponema sp.]MDY5916951.1 OadG family protein [Treponema sp.]MDY6189793.1 OadG family protein [Treponema sp.]
MTITEMLGQSGLLTLLGMCVVFSFIIIMILGMKLLHVVLHALKLDVDKPTDSVNAVGTSANVNASTVSSAANNDAVVAAIAAAVHDKIINS